MNAAQPDLGVDTRPVHIVPVSRRAPHIVGQYALYGEIAAGGMATVHYGRFNGPAGFARTVAIKRLHPQYAKDPEFVSMFLDEARLVGRIRHPNVVQTLDVVALDGELFLVMDYVQGESLARLLRESGATGTPIPLPIVSSILCGSLHGLHAAHEATDERGEPLRIVHRDVSPQNLLVGADGVSRVLDFGVAKAVGRCRTTRDGGLKGKLAYMAPEQFDGKVDRRTDVFGAGVVLWEALTMSRLFGGDNEANIMAKVFTLDVPAPSKLMPGVPRELDAIVLRALQRDPAERFGTVRDMARALEACIPMASAPRTADWLGTMAGEVLADRAKAVAEVELESGGWRARSGSRPMMVEDAEPPPCQRSNDATRTDAVTEGDRPSAISGTRLLLEPRPSGRARALYLTGLAAVVASVFALVNHRPTALPMASASVAVPLVDSALTVDETPPPRLAPVPVATATSTRPERAVVATRPHATATHARTAAISPPKVTAHKDAPDCSPPFTVDDNGFRHYKRECEQ